MDLLLIELVYPDKLKVQLDAMSNSDFLMCYAGIQDIEPNGSIIREYLPHYSSGYMFEQQLFQFEVNNVTPLYRKKTMSKYNIFFARHNVLGLNELNRSKV